MQGPLFQGIELWILLLKILLNTLKHAILAITEQLTLPVFS